MKQLQAIFDQCPTWFLEKNAKGRATWDRLGPLNLESLVRDNEIKFDQDLEFQEVGNYYGQVNSKGEKHGFGRELCFGNDCYEGQFRNGKQKGHGRKINGFNGSYRIGKMKDFKQYEGYQSTLYNANGEVKQ